MNDIFKPEINHPELMKENEMVIYDRWGRLVFTTQEYSTGWDGNNNHEQPCSTGVYYCLIHVIDMSNNTFTHHTSVTLIR
jgi:gliding motility-associated-like protein